MIRLACLLLSLTAILSCRSPKDVTPRVYNFEPVTEVLLDSIARYRGNVLVLVSQAERPVYEFELAMNKREAIPLASATKWLSGAVIMALVDEGKLSLNDTVGKYLPNFTRYGKGHITLRQLFSHTSGLPGNTPQGFEVRRVLTLAQAVDSIGRTTKLLSTPGTAFFYGDLGMHVAGRMAEVASGKSWPVLFKEKIAQPCNMLYTVYTNGNNPGIAIGAASVGPDYLNFLEMLVNNGVYEGQRVLSEAAIQEMEKDQTNGASMAYTVYPQNPYTPTGVQTPLRYGIGVWRDVTNPGSSTPTEVSSPGIFGVHPWINRKQKIAGIIFTMSSYGDTWLTSLKVRELIRKEVGQ
ncbi:hypothetical protein GCM10023189_03190 [Nibrella saemangeumensis]|uniref:Beta-lactamase-related domain-containing protein n=1 Tax=Nibrella saemangeumensis TaxID=1084526 RepID=A0ABP8MCD5_9BACT